MSAYDDMISRLGGSEHVVEGSFYTDNLAAVAEEVERLDAVLDYMPNRFFPTLASGEDLTLAAANFGVVRKGATAATVTLTITGDAGTVIDGSIKAAAGDMIYDCASAVIPDSGSVDVTATCETAGAEGNVAVGTVTELLDAYAGIDSVTNALAATGGADEESDEDLLERVKARWQSPSTGGNRADYITWALSVDGVSRAIALNPSAGHVSVYIVATGNTAASSALISSVAAYIETVRPIGAAVTVASATAVPINASVTATIADGYTVASVKASITEALKSYIAGLGLEAAQVSYLRIADLLFVDGVTDVTAYTLNGGTSAISLSETEFAQMGTVTVNGN